MSRVRLVLLWHSCQGRFTQLEAGGPFKYSGFTLVGSGDADNDRIRRRLSGDARRKDLRRVERDREHRHGGASVRHHRVGIYGGVGVGAQVGNVHDSRGRMPELRDDV